MSNTDSFREEINKGYQFKGESIILGAAKLDGEVVAGTQVRVPLKTMNRHGLIAGATGTGKTKSLQGLAESLSKAGVPSLLMDIKGDLSGLARPGEPLPFILERSDAAGVEYHPQGFPVEFLTLSDEKGARLRATTTEFGPVLFTKILGLNETQEGIVSVIFKYCDDRGLTLLDLKDFIAVIQYLGSDKEAKAEFEADYRKISSVSLGIILRKLIELKQQGADLFFGETSFDVQDLMRLDKNGYGIQSILRVTDLLDRPKLFSTFMLSLLAELYSTLPEMGDLDKPKLVIFIDEAHLIFSEATKALLQQIETVVRLIRSKGVGVFFCTQNPQDIPYSVLSQLGLKIQHALRAFTAKDRKTIKEAAQNYPETQFYKTEDEITRLGIGEALVTCLNEKGIPTPLAVTFMLPPESRMDVLTEAEIDSVINSSKIIAKYNQEVDRESAYEMLNKKVETRQEDTKKEAEKKDKPWETRPVRKTPVKSKSGVEKVLDSTAGRQVTRTVANIITRTLLGAIGLGGTKKKGSWF